MKARGLAAAAFLTGAPALAAQADMADFAAGLVATRSGRVILAHYQGIISWTWNTGSAIEAVEQLGGEVTYDAKTKAVIPPKELTGGWNVSTDDGSEHTSMTWRLCRVGGAAAVPVMPGPGPEKNSCLPRPRKAP